MASCTDSPRGAYYRANPIAANENDDFLESRYKCTAEWHLWRLRDRKGQRAPLAVPLYSFAWMISKNSGRFYCSAVNLAAHFGVNQSTVLRALDALAKSGFFVVISKEPFQPSIYQVVKHNDWAKSHPHSCAQKVTFPWSAEQGDELGVCLYAASGGRVRWYPNLLAAIRKTGLSDDEVVREFENFFAFENERRQAGGWHGHWKSVAFRFLKFLKGEL